MNTILKSARAVLFALLMLPLATQAAEPTPPAGFRALFNSKDLAGWYGLNPHLVDKLTGEKLDAALKKMRDEFPTNWRVENGELVNDGHGPYATTDAELGDIEFLLEYKTVAKADSGVYLRGLPQVQIWDISQPSLHTAPDRNPNRGSGGLFNNLPRTPAAIRWSSPTNRSANGIRSAFAKSARGRGCGSTTNSWSMTL